MSTRPERTAYLAGWIVPVSEPPIQDGAVLVEAGRIAAVTNADKVRSGQVAADRVVDFGRSVALPGLVNTHAHLELTALRGFLEGLDFGSWLRVLTAVRTDLFDQRDLYVASMAGVREGLLAGITTFGDASATGVPMRAMIDAGVRGILYQEVFGPDPAQRQASMEGLARNVERLQAQQTTRVNVGVSPHAPYTVSTRLFEDVARFATRGKLPVAVHVAESASETEFVRDGKGHFAERLRARGIAEAPHFRSPVALLDATGLLETRPLLIHAIHVDNEDLDLISASGASIAHCPVSNAKLGQGIAPLMKMMHRGIAVGLGSDSVASNNRMDVLMEARQAALFSAITSAGNVALTATDAIALATLGGAAALGLDHTIGSLEVGKAADIAVFDLEETIFGPVQDPLVTLVHTLAGRVKATCVLIDGIEMVSRGVLVQEALELHANMMSLADRLHEWRRSNAPNGVS